MFNSLLSVLAGALYLKHSLASDKITLDCGQYTQHSGMGVVEQLGALSSILGACLCVILVNFLRGD